MYSELAQKLDRKIDSIRSWFKERRAKERKANAKLETGPFSIDSRQILLASFNANQYPGRYKLFLYSHIIYYYMIYITSLRIFTWDSSPSFYNNIPKRWIPWISNSPQPEKRIDQELVSRPTTERKTTSRTKTCPWRTVARESRNNNRGSFLYNLEGRNQIK